MHQINYFQKKKTSCLILLSKVNNVGTHTELVPIKNDKASLKVRNKPIHTHSHSVTFEAEVMVTICFNSLFKDVYRKNRQDKRVIYCPAWPLQ